MPPAAPSTAAAATAGGPPPNQTLYVSNLPDTKIRKPDLRLALYTLFSTYGVVLDVVALLTMKHRGQAHIVFRDVASATTAMRELQGFRFLGKDMVSGVFFLFFWRLVLGYTGIMLWLR